MPIELAEVVDADMDRIMQFQYDAFADPHEPFYDVLFPGGNAADVLARNGDRTLERWHGDPAATFLKAVDTETGEIVAAAMWVVHPSYDAAAEAPKPSEPLTVTWFDDEDDCRYTEFVLEEIERKKNEKLTGPFCRLHILFTDPKHQRRGAGSKLVQWGTAKADELGVEAFVEATQYGLPLYEQNDFVTHEHTFFKSDRWPDKPEIHAWFMARPARGKA